ncbi:hypothetical protein HYV84_00885 [Candidatus Woesearchaeota archaeon]|nr:hypothetical protein [Candidatus Woesearchaeota archaeon]
MMENGVYVKIGDYKDVLEVMGMIKDKIAHAKAIIGKIKNLKEREDAELGSWSGKLESVEQKVNDLDAALLRPSL